MLLDLLDAIGAQPVRRLALDQPVAEIHGLQPPPPWHLLAPDLLLPRQHVRPDLLPVIPILRPPAQHHLLHHDPKSLVVCPEVMVGIANDLGRHLSWGSRCIHVVVLH